MPVISQQDATVHGSAVSGVATNLDTQNQNEGPSGVSGANGPIGDNETSGSTGTNGPTGTTGPDTTRVSAENVRAGIQMPTFIPQVALDHSNALNVSTGNLTAPGNNAGASAQESINANSNASFGQGISDSQPESAKTDGRSFGQSTSISARSNSRRP